MGYERWWETLEILIAEFRKRRISIHPETMISLRSARTLISIYQADTSRLESTPTIEGQLVGIESTLINTAKEELGSAYAEKWLSRLDRARKEDEATADAPRFLTGLPRDDHWVRVLPSDDLLRADVESLAEQLKLSSRAQGDGYILLHGKKENVKAFIKEIAKKRRRAVAALKGN